MGTLSIHPLAKLLVIMLPMNWLFTLLPSVLNSSCYSNPALSSVAKITHKKRNKVIGMALHTGLSRHWPGWNVAGTPNHSCKPALDAPVSFSHSGGQVSWTSCAIHHPVFSYLSYKQLIPVPENPLHWITTNHNCWALEMSIQILLNSKRPKLLFTVNFEISILNWEVV